MSPAPKVGDHAVDLSESSAEKPAAGGKRPVPAAGGKKSPGSPSKKVALHSTKKKHSVSPSKKKGGPGPGPAAGGQRAPRSTAQSNVILVGTGRVVVIDGVNIGSFLQHVGSY